MSNGQATKTIWVVETSLGTLETADYDEARAWNRANIGSSMDRKDNT